MTKVVLDYDEMRGFVEHEAVDESKPKCLEESFALTDDNLIEVNEYYTQQAIKQASHAAIDSPTTEAA